MMIEERTHTVTGHETNLAESILETSFLCELGKFDVILGSRRERKSVNEIGTE
jgi:hypothetical protein